jgi:hypothetical protein
MIIVQLKGGLGNQLFQYAAGLSLASFHHTDVKVDVSEVNRSDKQIGTFRSFDLQQILLEPIIASEAEIKKVQPQGINKYIEKIKKPYQRRCYKEVDFSFDEHFFKAKDNIYLKGYRQSEKYFQGIKEKIRTEFQIKPSVIERVEEKAEQIRNEHSIAIHIRRGDFSNAIVREYHGVLDATYYQQAITRLKSQIGECRFYIFSDDPTWVGENLQFPSAIDIVSGNISQSAIEDFYLISQCKHQIIANSTFSWWAAWLNPNPDKIVIAPKKWFNNAPYDTRDLIPDSWIKM